MSKVIFAFLIISFFFLFLLLVFIVVFTLAILLFAGIGKKGKEKVLPAVHKRAEIEEEARSLGIGVGGVEIRKDKGNQNS